MPKPSYLLVKIRKLKKRNKNLSLEKAHLLDLNYKYEDLLKDCFVMLVRYRTFLLKPSRAKNKDICDKIVRELFLLNDVKQTLQKHKI